MRVLIDVHHPAHVHFFRHLIGELHALGHETRVVARDKECTLALLEAYGIDYALLSRYEGGFGGLAREMAVRHVGLGRVLDEFGPDRMIGIAGLSITHHGRLRGVRTFAFTDTDHAKLSHAIFLRWAHRICTPTCYPRRYGRWQSFHPSYHELAYLHPARFDRSASAAVLARHGIDPVRPYVVCRFVSWKAAHDLGHRGLVGEQKKALIEALGRLGRVYVTSEAPLPPDLEPFRLSLPATEIHHVLAHAALYVGEGATMASESAMLGTPSIYVNPLACCTTTEQQRRYGVLEHLPAPTVEGVMREADRFLDPTSGERFREGHARMLAEKVDLTAWMLERLLAR